MEPLAPCQLIFFDSPIRLTADEANTWVVRAFADTLKAEVWVTVDPDKYLNDTAFVPILHEFRNHLSCTSITGHELGNPSKPLPADHIALSLAFGNPPLHGSDKQLKPSKKLTVKDVGDGVRAYRLELFISGEENIGW